MNILTDRHHPSLTYSLELLFGKRLGHRLMAPIGFEWYEEGAFKYFSHLTPVDSHLNLARADSRVWGQKDVLTGSGLETVDPGIYYCPDITKDLYERGISWSQFLERPIDFFIASIPEHVEPFDRLIKRFKPKAKLIFQMGNMFDYFDLKGVRNILNSTDRVIPEGIHSVSYSQEFDLNLFKFTRPIASRNLVNFVNYWEDFNNDSEFHKKVLKSLPGYRFESYGSDNEDGVLTKTADVAQKLKDADFVWHLKRGGDGYGHVLHNAAAVGRPIVLSKKTYGPLRFGKFIKDGETCIDTDGLSPEELANKIIYYNHPRRHEKMCRQIHERFKEFVNFEEDARRVGAFLENLR